MFIYILYIKRLKENNGRAGACVGACTYTRAYMEETQILNKILTRIRLDVKLLTDRKGDEQKCKHNKSKFQS